MTTKHNLWEENDMKRAVQAVLSGKVGFKKAANMYNVPRTSLFRNVSSVKAGIPTNLGHKKIGRKAVLCPELENLLVEYALEMQRNYFGMTRRDLREMAYQLAVQNGIPNPFGKGEAAGE